MYVSKGSLCPVCSEETVKEQELKQGNNSGAIVTIRGRHVGELGPGCGGDVLRSSHGFVKPVLNKKLLTDLMWSVCVRKRIGVTLKFLKP